MLTVDRHLLISCAPRYVGSSKQLRSVKNTEKQDVANSAVVAEMVEAHVCILHFQLLDKHFFKRFLLETGLGRQTLQSLPSSLAPPLFVPWLLSSWLQSDSSSRSCIAYTFSLPQLRCSHKMSRLTSMSRSLLWGICAPNTIDISRQAPKASKEDFPFHVSRDAGLQKLSRQCRWLCWAGWEKPSKILVGQCLDETPEQKARSHPQGCPCSPRRAKWQQLCITHILSFSYFNIWNRC